jgi:hypothetical protein
VPASRAIREHLRVGALQQFLGAHLPVTVGSVTGAATPPQVVVDHQVVGIDRLAAAAAAHTVDELAIRGALPHRPFRVTPILLQVLAEQALASRAVNLR